MTKLILLDFYLFVWIWNPFLQVCGQSYQDLYRLHQVIFSNYSADMRPLLNQSDRIELSPSFELISLVEVDEIKQKVTINGLLGLKWKDELLTWNPSSYNGIRHTTTIPTQIWRPRLALFNTMSDRDLFEDDYAPLWINYDGDIAWYPGGLFPVLCLLDLRKFPFDKHRCTIRLAPMSIDPSEMIIDVTSSLVGRSNFYPHGEWDVSETSISTFVFTASYNVSSYMIDFDFRISRKPGFFILNVYLPVLFLCAINGLTFLIPPGEGEKIGFSTAVLLSMSVYMGVVGDKLPANSENMPYMTHYIFLLFGLSVICCVDNIFIVWLLNKEEREEKKQKRRSQLENISGRLGILKAFHKPFDDSKIFPHSSEVHPSHSNDEKYFKNPTPDAQKPTANVPHDLHIRDDVQIISSKAKLPIPNVNTTGKDCIEGNSARVKRNRYKNMAHKMNKYSAVIFGIVSFTVTIVHLALMMS